ncbi:putative CBL-interacting protein kinase 26 [Blattamonas nauphoetae]|uniref:CBL-interacting protein kinase 26 n=1 Tax=Blattamonas nauphoetae TaxID=2049346 RepID=A0ABQ9Y2Y5_9EUKA|nr:putative CBL-interacting protein kinase 26 [Blattamonas nauphoetae]
MPPTNSVQQDQQIIAQFGYQDIRYITHGEFGHVFRAKKNGADVAIKTIAMSVFRQQEYSIALDMKNTDCQNIIKVIEKKQHDATMVVLLVMEYANSGTLSQLIDGVYYTPNEDLARSYLRQLLNGLKAIHDAGYAHRDLKCDNVYLDQPFPNAPFVIKIGDMGMCKRDVSEDLMHTMIGTPLNWAPEMLSPTRPFLGLQRHYSNKVDIWAAGCIFYQLLTRVHPFAAKTPNELTQKVNAGVKRAAGISDSAFDLIGHLLDPNPSTRYNCEQALRHPFFPTSQYANQLTKSRLVFNAPPPVMNKPRPFGENQPKPKTVATGNKSPSPGPQKPGQPFVAAPPPICTYAEMNKGAESLCQYLLGREVYADVIAIFGYIEGRRQAVLGSRPPGSPAPLETPFSKPFYDKGLSGAQKKEVPHLFSTALLQLMSSKGADQEVTRRGKLATLQEIIGSTVSGEVVIFTQALQRAPVHLVWGGVNEESLKNVCAHIDNFLMSGGSEIYVKKEEENKMNDPAFMNIVRGRAVKDGLALFSFLSKDTRLSSTITFRTDKFGNKAAETQTDVKRDTKRQYAIISLTYRLTGRCAQMAKTLAKAFE